MKLILDGNSLSTSDVFFASTLKNSKLSISAKAKENVKKSRAVVEEWLKKKEVIYGVTTGFGIFSTIKIPTEKIDELQKNLIISHSAGVGELLPDEIVKAMIILRINAIVKGFSGVRLELINSMINFFNSGLLPLVPSQGSVGSSGDLVPLSHLILPIIGYGKVKLPNGKIVSAKVGLKKYNLKPVILTAKEGLALINGTQMMSAFASHISYRAENILKLADIICALSVEALKGTDTAFDERIHKLRNYKGQNQVAKNLRRLMQNSEIRNSHRLNDERVQDPYSLRCAPQVHGASRDALNYFFNVCKIEINSATDNPLIFAKEKIHLEGGNFHGQPIALALDFASIALSEIANISERRIDKLVNGSFKELPKFLTKRGGLHSGLMIAQYTAASLVSENKVLSHPASVDSIPTSAGQEDHNSMGSIAATKCFKILQNVENALSIELFCAAQALDFHHPLKPGKGVLIAYQTIRKFLKHFDKDVILQNEFEKSLKLFRSGIIEKNVESKIGKLD